MGQVAYGVARCARLSVMSVGLLVSSGLAGCFDDDRSRSQSPLTGVVRQVPLATIPPQNGNPFVPNPALRTPPPNSNLPPVGTPSGSPPPPVPTSSAPPITSGVGPTDPGVGAAPPPVSSAPPPAGTPAPAPGPAPAPEPAPPQPATGSATLSWEAPTENTDGTPIVGLAGYKILYGTDSGALDRTVEVASAGITRYVVEPLDRGVTYYFAIAALTTGGVEGVRSDVVSKTIQ